MYYLHVCTCTYMYIHVHTCTYMYIHVHVHVYTCTYMYIHVRVHVHCFMYVHECIFSLVYRKLLNKSKCLYNFCVYKIFCMSIIYFLVSSTNFPLSRVKNRHALVSVSMDGHTMYMCMCRNIVPGKTYT